ncbi:MAG TPA: glycosyltransferase family 39 protein [Pyrinomonadaceae bacterium]|nr:glycosyltransferase family 39 protein [Pyrinomonadaceae bacterium]
MAVSADAIITAGLRPELFAERGLVSISRTILIAVLSLLVLAGFGIRVSNLSAEGLSEDELNKLHAVADYRANGLTAANSEHPFLMKALQTSSVFLADKWNTSSFGAARAVAPETALRLPGAIFGALTVVLLYLLTAELFGAEVGLIAAALWTFDPMAIGLNRIAKEDTFLLFFFLLANVFWLRGQRIAESKSGERPEKYYWLTAASFGAVLASKYLPQALTISMAYYWLFQRIPETRWRLGKKRMLIFFGIMGLTFVVLNPTILLPATWRQMGLFAGQKLVGHDGYEFMGQLYSHRMTDWLNGIPWYFYHLAVAVKLPVLAVIGFVAGLPLLFRRKLGDGRFFIGLWLILWMMTFSFTGGKFLRYFTLALPAVLIVAALGVQFISCWLARFFSRLLSARSPRMYLRAAVAGLVIAGSIEASAKAAPHFRLYTNELGGGMKNAGYFFPHDEFYDASLREIMLEIAKRARPGARVASETPSVAGYYAQRAGRPDLVCVMLSDPKEWKQMSDGDFVIDARGRRYFSNELVLQTLRQATTPAFQVSLGSVHSASVYMLDQKAREAIRP